ncbi:MAG: LapA family protein [Candidatus Margulisiibacteriota bacterium]
MWFNIFVILTVSLGVTAFAVANSTPVSVNLIFWQSRQMSLSIVILVSVLTGFSFAGLLALYQKIKDLLKMADLEAKLRRAQQQNNEKEAAG